MEKHTKYPHLTGFCIFLLFRRELIHPGYGIFILPGDGKLDVTEVEEVHIDAGDGGAVDQEGAVGRYLSSQDSKK